MKRLIFSNSYYMLGVLVFSLTLFTARAQNPVQNINQPQKKIALVIGNGNYSLSILANPENDAKSIMIALQDVGFTVMEYENLTQGQMKKAIDDFGERLKEYEVGLFYYAGHGIQSKGYNYLIPVDAELKSEIQVEYDCVQADRVLAMMEASGAKVNIIILDACRNNPFERGWTRSSTGKGLAFMNAPSGTLIAYATAPGSTASDGSGQNGLYTSAILESIQIPNINIIQMFQNVRSIVSQKSGKLQIPWESTSLTGDFYFKIETPPNANNEPVNSKNELLQNNINGRSAEVSFEKSLLRNFEWSVNSLNSYVKSFVEKTYTVENKYGVWMPKNQLNQIAVTFDENGFIKEVSSGKGSSNKWSYQMVGTDSVIAVEYNSNGKALKSSLIYFQNDSTVLSGADTYKMRNEKVTNKVGKIVNYTESGALILGEDWIYSSDGLISLKNEVSLKSKQVFARYEYLEFDKKGNWTKRLEYGTSDKPTFIVIRDYTY